MCLTFNKKNMIYSNLFGNVIHTYSRKNALEDGVQFCLSERFPKECCLYKYTVFCTGAVWDLIESATINNPGTDQAGVVWDLMWMSTKSPFRTHPTPDTCLFTLIIQGANRKPDFWEDEFPIYRLQSKCEAKDFDDPTPVVTISLPFED